MKQVSIYFLAIICAGLITGCGNDNNASKDTNKNSGVIFDSIAMKKIIDEKTNKFTYKHILQKTLRI
ncbi:MAG: hypothetical protein IPH33_14355 [Bacteroidetes bacterium]|nr:hypothetical protein [Bacteroidota bacterium]